MAEGSSPDVNAAGLLREPVDPLRYEIERTLDANEVPGIIAVMIPAGAKVLDIGCGEGVMTKLLADSCHADFWGIEADLTRAARAAERGVNVRAGFFEPRLVRDVAPFDVVLFADVLEHLPNPQNILTACREILSPGGAVIVSIPNVAHWSVRLEVLQGRFRYQPTGIMDATHLRWFTAASAKALLESAGFEAIGWRSTAGVIVPDNITRAPLCWMPRKLRDSFLRVGARRWPTLFGAQHVIKARMR